MIAPETPDDVDAISGVVRRAFATHVEVVDMVLGIRASSRYRPELAFVARVDGAVAGFVMISGVDLVDADATVRDVLSLTPLAVDPPFQRRGIGSALVRTAIGVADSTGAPLVALRAARPTTGGWGSGRPRSSVSRSTCPTGRRPRLLRCFRSRRTTGRTAVASATRPPSPP